jgi:hypothetical protein
MVDAVVVHEGKVEHDGQIEGAVKVYRREQLFH